MERQILKRWIDPATVPSEVQLWHNDKDVTFLVSSAQNVIVN